MSPEEMTDMQELADRLASYDGDLSKWCALTMNKTIKHIKTLEARNDAYIATANAALQNAYAEIKRLQELSTWPTENTARWRKTLEGEIDEKKQWIGRYDEQAAYVARLEAAYLALYESHTYYHGRHYDESIVERQELASESLERIKRGDGL